MPKILIISDTHGTHHSVVLPLGDILIHAGDFEKRSDEPNTIDFLKWFESQPHQHKIFIAGNHCFLSEQKPAKFAKLVKEYAPSCHYLCDSGVTAEGLKIYGSPITPTFCDWAWNRDRGTDIKEHWDKIPKDTQVLVTHGPPHDILDQVMGSRPNQGCRDLADTIKTLPNLKLHVFGHLHLMGGQQVKVGNIVYVNAAMVNEAYNLVNKAQIVDIET